MNPIAYGTKYASTKDLSRVEVAKLIRADIKDAVKAGTIPAAKYSVTCESFAGGGSIDVRIADVKKAGFVLWNPLRLAWDTQNPHSGLCDAPSEARWLHSEEARALLDAVKAIVDAYNFDGSDSQTDHFHVRFYGQVEFSWRWADAKKEEEIAAMTPAGVTPGEPSNDVAQAPRAPQAAWLESLGVEV